jgi:CPA2 family monovalent cation:H+ antiporter-2
MIIALSATILPPRGLLILVLIVVVLLTAILWRWFIKLHSHLQITLMDTFKKKK